MAPPLGPFCGAPLRLTLPSAAGDRWGRRPRGESFLRCESINESPSIGAIVVTADGEELGRVKQIAGACFEVDAPLQPDYWLAPDVIDVATPETVQLLLTRRDIASVIEPGTEHTGYHVHPRET